MTLSVTEPGRSADLALGQDDATSREDDRGDRDGVASFRRPHAVAGDDAVLDDSLCWPYGLSWSGDLLGVADSGDNRVMFWRLG